MGLSLRADYRIKEKVKTSVPPKSKQQKRTLNYS
jgi:hypothetical protein